MWEPTGEDISAGKNNFANTVKNYIDILSEDRKFDIKKTDDIAVTCLPLIALREVQAACLIMTHALH